MTTLLAVALVWGTLISGSPEFVPSSIAPPLCISALMKMTPVMPLDSIKLRISVRSVANAPRVVRLCGRIEGHRADHEFPRGSGIEQRGFEPLLLARCNVVAVEH